MTPKIIGILLLNRLTYYHQLFEQIGPCHMQGDEKRKRESKKQIHWQNNNQMFLGVKNRTSLPQFSTIYFRTLNLPREFFHKVLYYVTSLGLVGCMQIQRSEKIPRRNIIEGTIYCLTRRTNQKKGQTKIQNHSYHTLSTLSKHIHNISQRPTKENKRNKELHMLKLWEVWTKRVILTCNPFLKIAFPSGCHNVLGNPTTRPLANQKL